MPSLIRREFIGERRPRPDQRHVTADHIEKLRQLVETASAKEFTQRGDSAIISQLVNAFALALRSDAFRGAGDQLADVFLVNVRVIVDIHGPKLKECKARAVLPDARLPEEDGSLRARF